MSKANTAEARFAFGENWLTFLSSLSEEQIQEAEQAVTDLCGDLKGKTFLDIGSGSGLSSLAAYRLGAKVHSFDYDQQSVEATKSLSNGRWPVEQGSVLDPSVVSRLGQFDVVYSWGVLHHTGAMIEAIRIAASAVKPGGLFAFALYRKTRLCWFWKIEKLIYSRSPTFVQSIICKIYTIIYRFAFALGGKNYTLTRGMKFDIDTHDWLGGYPYESIGPLDVASLMNTLGFTHIKDNARPYSLGLLGSGCDEFVYARTAGQSTNTTDI